jgi:hypothetical protein
MRVAKVQISFDLIRAVLQLPVDTDLVGVKYERPNELALYVKHENLKKFTGTEGEEPPTVRPKISYSFDWNQK